MAKKKKSEKVVEEVKTTPVDEVISTDQVIECDYDKDLVEKYKSEYIMEEDGIGADIEAEPSDLQSTFNEVPFSDMIDEGEVIIEEGE